MISNQIKQLRQHKGYSQQVLAEKCGLSLRTIQRVENEETQPRGDTLIRLTKALEVSPDELANWNKREDKTYLNVLNISALSFILFPLLGIILPFILWITKRDQIQGVNEMGKDLLNFQITWAMVFFIGYIGYIAWFFNHVRFISPSMSFKIYWFIGVLYATNVAMILFNSIRLAKDKTLWYYPRINFIR